MSSGRNFMCERTLTSHLVNGMLLVIKTGAKIGEKRIFCIFRSSTPNFIVKKKQMTKKYHDLFQAFMFGKYEGWKTCYDSKCNHQSLISKGAWQPPISYRTSLNNFIICIPFWETDESMRMLEVLAVQDEALRIDKKMY